VILSSNPKFDEICKISVSTYSSIISAVHLLFIFIIRNWNFSTKSIFVLKIALNYDNLINQYPNDETEVKLVKI